MTGFLAAVTVVLGGAILANLWAVVVRPQVFDKIIGVGMIGTQTTVLIGLTGALFHRLDAFVDIALTYAMLSFTVTLAVAKYFGLQKREGA